VEKNAAKLDQLEVKLSGHYYALRYVEQKQPRGGKDMQTIYIDHFAQHCLGDRQRAVQLIGEVVLQNCAILNNIFAVCLQRTESFRIGMENQYKL